MPVRFGDLWEPYIRKDGRVVFRRKDSLHGRKPVKVETSSKYLYLTREDGEEIWVRRAGGTAFCPGCGRSPAGKVLKWRKRKNGYIAIEMRVKCENCETVFDAKEYIYDYEKEKL